MRRLGYDSAFGSAIIAVGGVVDLLIPPSIILVIYAIIAEQNIAKLFQAALIPGIFAVVLYSTVIRIVAGRNPQLAPIQKKVERASLTSDSFAKVWLALIVILVVLGGIYTGIFTPTEAAGVGAVLMLLAGLVQRRLRLGGFRIQLDSDRNHLRDDLQRSSGSRDLQWLSCIDADA